MKVKMPDQFRFTEEFKEKLVLIVVYQNRALKNLAKK